MKKTFNLFTLILLIIYVHTTYANVYYVDQATGSDNSGVDGSINAPFKTINHAFDVMNEPASPPTLTPPHTLIIRKGTYREIKYLDITKNMSGNPTAPTVIKAYPGEQVIINGGTLANDPARWVREGTTGVWWYQDAVYSTYRNVSVDGKPLRLMAAYPEEFKIANSANSAAAITSFGQWSRLEQDRNIPNGTSNSYLWVKVNAAGDNPGNKNIEVSYKQHILYVYNEAQYIQIQDITFENAYYPLLIEGSHVTLLNVVSRNSFGDAIKIEGCSNSKCGPILDSQYGVIDNCNLYNFGESGIDITGGDYWKVKHCRIHDSVSNRIDKNGNNDNNNNGIMFKNDSEGVALIENSIYNMSPTTFGAISAGGDTYNPNVPVIKDGLVFGNIIDNVFGPYALALAGAQNTVIANNLIVNSNFVGSSVASSPDALIELRQGVCEPDPTHCPTGVVYIPAKNNQIANNIYYNNIATLFYHETIVSGLSSDDSTVINSNFYDTQKPSVFDNWSTPASATTKGYDTNSLPISSADFLNVANSLYYPNKTGYLIDKAQTISTNNPANNNAWLNDALQSVAGKKGDIGPYEYYPPNEVANFTNTATWATSSGMVISSAFDSQLGGYALTFNGAIDDSFHFIESATTNPTGSRYVSFWTKSKDAQTDDQIAFRVYTSSGVFRILKFYGSYTSPNLSNPNDAIRYQLAYPLAQQTNDGTWRKYHFDLQALLQSALPAESIVYVERVYINGGSSIAMLQLDSNAIHSSLPFGQISYWPLDEGKGTYTTDTARASSCQLKGIFTAADNPILDQWTSGKAHFALRFSSTGVTTNGNGVVECSPPANSLQNGLTASFWLNPLATGVDYQAIVSGLLGDSQYARIFKRFDSSTNKYYLTLQFNTENGIFSRDTSVGTIVPGVWQNIVAVIDQSSHKATIYLNGVALNSWTISGNQLTTGLSVLRIGGDPIATHTLDGAMDEVRLFNRPLNDHDVADLYTMEVTRSE